MRRILALAAVLACLAAVPAEAAAPRKVCRLLTDASGDGQVLLAVPNDTASADLVSADVATGAKMLAVAVRLRSLAPDPTVTLGVQYTVQFTVSGKPWWVRFTREAGRDDRAEYGEGEPGIKLGPANAAIDVQTGTVTLTVPRRNVPGLTRAKLGGLAVRTYLSTGGFFTQADAGTSTAGYADRTPSCVGVA